MKWICAGRSDVGKVRRGNEDGALGLVTTTLGLTFTWEAKRW